MLGAQSLPSGITRVAQCAYSDYVESGSRQDVELYGAREARVLVSGSAGPHLEGVAVHLTDVPTSAAAVKQEYAVLVHDGKVFAGFLLPFVAVRSQPRGSTRQVKFEIAIRESGSGLRVGDTAQLEPSHVAHVSATIRSTIMYAHFECR